ncbi:MAG: hypothetical protein RLZZ292_2170 [Bacteroidota bacterium]|jgi:hypothetical protein
MKKNYYFTLILCFFASVLFAKPLKTVFSLSDSTKKSYQRSVLLKQGTQLVFSLQQPVDASNLTVGSIILLHVSLKLRVEGDWIFGDDCTAWARVIAIEHPGIYGKAGALVWEIYNTQSKDGQQVAVESQQYHQVGKNKKRMAWALSMGLPLLIAATPIDFTAPLFLSLGVWVRGNEARIDKDCTFGGQVASDLMILTKFSRDGSKGETTARLEF